MMIDQNGLKNNLDLEIGERGAGHKALKHALIRRIQAAAGLRDYAATYVLNRLGLDIHLPRSEAISVDTHQCQAIDQCVLDFLGRYPESQGIEVAAGLSTRFHRLSGLLDWPMFSWVTFNTPAICHLQKKIFPKTENFFTHEFSNIRDCIDKIEWEIGPKILIIENPSTFQNEDALNVFFLALLDRLQETKTTVEIVLSHQFGELGSFSNTCGNINLISSHSITIKQSRWQRLKNTMLTPTQGHGNYRVDHMTLCKTI